MIKILLCAMLLNCFSTDQFVNAAQHHQAPQQIKRPTVTARVAKGTAKTVTNTAKAVGTAAGMTAGAAVNVVKRSYAATKAIVVGLTNMTAAASSAANQINKAMLTIAKKFPEGLAKASAVLGTIVSMKQAIVNAKKNLSGTADNVIVGLKNQYAAFLNSPEYLEVMSMVNGKKTAVTANTSATKTSTTAVPKTIATNEPETVSKPLTTTTSEPTANVQQTTVTPTVSP